MSDQQPPKAPSNTAHTKAPTQLDVARAAGVSTATVSRVLNQPDIVRASIRQKVMHVIDQLNYVTDAAARTLASKRSGVMGAVIPTLSNAIFADGIEAFEAALTQAGYGLMLTTSNYDPKQELKQVKALITQGVDGILLVGHSHDPQVYTLLAQRQTPFIETWAYRNQPDYPCVGFDNYQAGKLAPSHLLALGHHKFAVITGFIEHNDRVQARLQGLLDTLAQSNIGLANEMLIHCPYDIASGRQACRQILNNPQRPTAIICHNDVLAMGALLECQAARIKVPEQVSIIGFDDLPLSANVTPSLTTLHIPFKQMGSRAAAYLLAELAYTHDGAPQRPMTNTELEVKLIVRQSTGHASNT